MCFGTPYLCICQPTQDFLNDYFQKNVAEIRKTKKALSMPNDASPDSSLAAPWIIIKNFARHCEEHLNRIIRCNLPQLNQLEFYHPNVDQVNLSPNSSFFRSCSLGGAQCGLHHGVLRECWLLCAQTWSCTRWCSRSLDRGMRSIPSPETWRTWAWGFKAVPHVTSQFFLFSHYGKLPDLESVYAWTVASLCFFAFTFSIVSLSGASGILSGILDTIF